MLNQALRLSVAAAALALSALPAFAGPTALSANTGWSYDSLDAAGAPTNDSPFTFTLLAGSVGTFKVTDFGLPGDSFDLYVNGSLAITLSSTAFAGAPHAVIGSDPVFSAEQEEAWRSDAFEKFAYTFSAPGDYSFEVRGDGAGGTPAGLGYRLDVTSQTVTVPEPGTLALVGLALAGLGCATRRRQNG